MTCLGRVLLVFYGAPRVAPRVHRRRALPRARAHRGLLAGVHFFAVGEEGEEADGRGYGAVGEVYADACGEDISEGDEVGFEQL